MTARGEAGFSLIETLVALLVLGIAAAGLIRATEGHIDATRGLEDRAAAQWVAENRLAELRLPGRPPSGPVPMLGHMWRVDAGEGRSDDPALVPVTVSVGYPDSATPLVSLKGFVDRGAGGGA